MVNSGYFQGLIRPENITVFMVICVIGTAVMRYTRRSINLRFEYFLLKKCQILYCISKDVTRKKKSKQAGLVSMMSFSLNIFQNTELGDTTENLLHSPLSQPQCSTGKKKTKTFIFRH